MANPTVFGVKIIGWLAADNRLFDRMCPSCKGLYSSFQHGTCPKCGTALGIIPGKNGRARAVSEGTLYVAWGDEQRKKNAADIQNRKNGMPIKYRFKIYSFADENGILTPPKLHGQCKRGAKVEIIYKNHEIVPSWFMTRRDKDGHQDVQVEFMFKIYEDEEHGDRLTILTPAQYSKQTVTYPVDKNGTPATLNIDDPEALRARLAQLEAEKAQREAAAGAGQQQLPFVPTEDNPF